MSLTTIGWLCIAWAFFLSVGIVGWVNIPTGLMLLGTALYILSEIRR